MVVIVERAHIHPTGVMDSTRECERCAGPGHKCGRGPHILSEPASLSYVRASEVMCLAHYHMRITRVFAHIEVHMN